VFLRPAGTGVSALSSALASFDWRQTPLGPRERWPAALEAIFAMMLDSPLAMCATWGPEQTLLYNAAYAPFLAQRHPAALGQPISEVWSDVWGDIGPLIQRVLGGEAVSFVDMHLVMTRNGYDEDTWWSFAYSPLRDGTEIKGILDIANETTAGVIAARQRDAAERAIRARNVALEQEVVARSEDRNALWTLSSDIMLRCTFEGVITASNPAWMAVLGWREHELIGSNLFDLIHPDDIAHTITGAKDLANGISHQRFDNRYRHRDGGYRWISWSTRPHDNVINAVGRDITRDKEQMAELETMQNALRQSQKMEAVGQLTGGLAHDFNNLLAGISGALQLMQMRMQQGRFSDFERYITTALGASRRAAALTHRLLAFSRQQTLTPKATNVNRLVVDMQELIQRTVGPAIPIEVVCVSDAWTALVDASQLENALLNLCINARDAMPDGGRITIETANKWIDERTARQQSMEQGQYLALSVSDTGTGMTPDVIARAFEPFFTTKPIGQGTGLGLSMIYGFAQQSGGQVRIYSEVGQGTTVCIYLPRHYGDSVDDAAPGTGAAGIATLEQSGKVATVLIVDDEPTVRMLVIDILQHLGFAWIEAADSATGLKVLQSDARIDLLVSDVGLPGGMNGRQMADAGRVGRPGLQVLFITGYAENAVLNNGYLEPGMAVLTKPFSMEEMAVRIRSMIETGVRPAAH
jgi:PAS domain S-box-containing protein